MDNTSLNWTFAEAYLVKQDSRVKDPSEAPTGCAMSHFWERCFMEEEIGEGLNEVKRRAMWNVQQLTALSAAVLWQFGHSFIEVLLEVTVLLYYKSVIISNEFEDNGKFAIQKLRENAKPLKFKLPLVLGTCGRGSSAPSLEIKLLCVYKKLHCQRDLCWDIQNLNSEEEWKA